MNGSRMNRKMLCLAVLVALVMIAPVAAAAGSKNNKSGATFVVMIEGLPAATFKSVSGLSMEVEVIEYREGGDTSAIRKLPGTLRYPNVTLKRGLAAGDALWQWMLKSAAGTHDPRKVTVAIYDADGKPIRTFILHDAFPVKWEAGDLDASGNEIAIESIEIAHEGLELAE